MQRVLVIIALLVTWCVAATYACAGNGLLSGFSGTFLRAFSGYVLILVLSQVIFRLFPETGMGRNPECE